MDRIAYGLTTIKNSSVVGKKYVEILHTVALQKVVEVMKDKGFVDNVKVFKPEGKPYKMLHVDLKYEDGVSKISKIVKVSKPSRRMYRGARELKPVAGGFGLSIVSTSKGVMDSNEARKRKLGGEVICYVV